MALSTEQLTEIFSSPAEEVNPIRIGVVSPGEHVARVVSDRPTRRGLGIFGSQASGEVKLQVVEPFAPATTELSQAPIQRLRVPQPVSAA